MRKLYLPLVLSGAFVFLAQSAWATNGHQMIGVGTYQKSMGGATTAAPYDTTSAVANPAGLALINSRADLSFEGFMPTRTADFENLGGESNQGGSPLYLVPSVGIAAPIGDDLVFGMGMFLTSGMGVDYDTMDVAPFNAVMGQLMGVTDPSMLDMTMWKGNIYSQYQFWKLAPSIAKRINDNLTVGVALNVDYQQMGFKQKFFDPNDSSSYMGYDLSRAVGALGFGLTAGVIYKVNDMFQVGATYISEQSFGDMEYRLSAGDIVTVPDKMGNTLVNSDGTYSLGLNFPQQIAVGVAVAPIQKLKITADVKWINFSATYDDPTIDGDFNVVNAQTGPTGQTKSSAPLPFGWDDVMVYALGVEFQATPAVTLRAGYNHGDSPIKEEDVFNNMAFPAIVQDHLALGAAFRLGENWELGLAFMKAFKNELEGKKDMTVLGQTMDSGAKMALEETSLLASVSYNIGR
ncbi:MAG: OmpP1/FadL family transporter [Candidatus Nitrospinota bacterium M3_3B_026]